MGARDRPVFIADVFSNYDGNRELVHLPVTPRELFEFMIDSGNEVKWAPTVITAARIEWDPETKNFEVIEDPEPAGEGAQFRQMNSYCGSFDPAYLPEPRSLVERIVLELKSAIFKATLTPNVYEITEVIDGEAFVLQTVENEGIFPFSLRYSFLPGRGESEDDPRTKLVIEMEIYTEGILRALALVPGARALIKWKIRRDMEEYVRALSVRPWTDPAADHKARTSR